MGEETETEVTRDVPPPTAEEQQFTQTQLKIAAGQLARIDRAGGFTARTIRDFIPILQNEINLLRPEQDALSRSNLAFGQEAVSAQDTLLQTALRHVEQGPTLTPEQDALISRATQSATDAALSDLGAFRDESLTALREELAPSLGLRPSDTPIVDRGQVVTRDANRVAGNVVQNLQAQAAQQRLQFPLQANAQQAQNIQAQQQLTGATAQFQEQLRQEAFNNRLRLTSVTGGLANQNASIGSFNLLPSFVNARVGGTTSTQTESGNFLDDFATVAGGVGGLATGAGDIGLRFG